MTTGLYLTSRRSFITLASLSTAASFIPHKLFAEELGIVPMMVNAAANAKIAVSHLRQNISVLEGSGGNIAVLTGKDGKLLVDAGFSVSRKGVLDALASINRDPISIT